MSIRVEVLSTPALVLGGQRHVLAPERRSQLLVWLALRGAWVPRAEVAALLWPGPQDAAYRNLRKALFRLHGVAWAGAIEQQPGALRCAAHTDLQDFERAVAERRHADALALSTGTLLPGYDDDANDAWTAWLAYEREQHRVAWRAAALARLDDALDPADGIALSARLLQLDPLDEAAMQQQLRWLAAAGQAARAQALWQAHVQRLRDELGVEPSASLQAAHAAIAAPAGTPVAAQRPAAATAKDDGFVGRATELREIDEWLLASRVRLLTLLGPGGTGKTRLARRVAERLAPQFADGVTWLALEEARSAEEVGRQLAQALGLRLTGGTPMLEQIVGVLRDQRRLLVLDNLEQLAPQAQPLELLLAACEQVQVLATSRVRLGLAAEQVLPLTGLPCPEPEDADELEQFDAARLFVQAARRVAPAFAPAREAAAIVEICRQVDGLPLALELAAAWTRVMPCAAIADELARGVELLHSADPSRPARQASFEAVFEQSWRLLGDAERQALARLAVFRGGFPAEAARTVTGAPWPVLGALADKSLLHRQGLRLVMHPLVQQLARARLAAPEADAVAAAHASHHLQLLAQLQHAVRNGDRTALQRLDAEWENCRAAWPLALRIGEHDPLRAALVTLRGYGDHRSRWTELLELVPDPALAGADAPLPLHGPLLALRAYLLYRLDRFEDAMAVAQQVLSGAHGDDGLAQRQSHSLLGSCCLRLNRLDEARTHYRHALKLARGADPRMAAQMLDNLSLVEKRQGRHDAALRMTTHALAQFRLLGDTASAALCLNNLGALQTDMGRYDEARANLEEAHATAERHGLAHTRLLASIGLTQAAAGQGRHADAIAYGRRALQVAEAAGQRSPVCRVHLVLAEVAAHAGQLDEARRELQAGVREALGLGMPPLAWYALTVFGQIAARAGEHEAAGRLFRWLLLQPQMSWAEQDQVRRRMQELGLAVTAEMAAASSPAWSIDELMQRVDVETPMAHALLLAELRG